MNGPNRNRQKGFTLIEMLVVIVIISILVTTSAFMIIDFMESRGLRGNGRVFESIFAQTRQLAQSKSENHFLIVRDESEDSPPKLLIVEDLARDGVPRGFSRNPNVNAGEDLLVRDRELSDKINVHLGNEEGAGPLVSGHDGNGDYWIRFGANGTINGGSVAPKDSMMPYKSNRTWRETNQPPSISNRRYDFLMSRVSGQKLFFDWEPSVGKIVSTYYVN